MRRWTTRRQCLALAGVAFQASREGILLTDRHNRILDVNPAFSTITGYTHDEVVGRNPRLLGSGLQDRTFYEALWTKLHAEGSWRGQLLNRRKSGEVYPQLLSISVLRDTAGAPTHYMALLFDISDIKESERALQHLADHDVLSGLPNRRLLSDRLHHAMLQTRRNGKPMAVCYLDLDAFKPVNDRLGHAAGDALLVEIARRLQGSVRAGDTVARFGGDEFVLVLGDLADAAECEQVLRRVLANVAAPVHIGGDTACVTASLGVVMFHGTAAEADDDGDSLLRRADRAMYTAKQDGHNCFRWGRDADPAPAPA